MNASLFVAWLIQMDENENILKSINTPFTIVSYQLATMERTNDNCNDEPTTDTQMEWINFQNRSKWK